MAGYVNIFIYSGPIQTGKTTSIIDWANKNKNVWGIAQPAIDGKRYLIDLHTKERRTFEVEKKDSEFISIGKFKFLKSSFEWAKIVLLHAAEQKPEWIIIDEFGKLELENKGLEPVITFLIKNKKLLISTKLIIVVRDYLLDQFLDKQKLNAGSVKIIKSLSEL